MIRVVSTGILWRRRGRLEIPGTVGEGLIRWAWPVIQLIIIILRCVDNMKSDTEGERGPSPETNRACSLRRPCDMAQSLGNLDPMKAGTLGEGLSETGPPVKLSIVGNARLRKRCPRARFLERGHPASWVEHPVPLLLPTASVYVHDYVSRRPRGLVCGQHHLMGPES